MNVSASICCVQRNKIELLPFSVRDVTYIACTGDSHEVYIIQLTTLVSTILLSFASIDSSSFESSLPSW
jgi:hypothetical protein